MTVPDVSGQLAGINKKEEEEGKEKEEEEEES